jgi:FHS family L-fucose permease-like MFS transporter
MWAAVAGLVLCTTVVLTPGTGMLNVIALTGISFFMSLMFPTIYGLALEDVAADDKKIGASGLIMAILGGAVITPVQGLISDAAGIHISYLVPVFCLVIVLAYAWAVETGKFVKAVSKEK